MTKTTCYRLVVTLQEDLHTGSGMGAGDIDALVMRDRKGNPVIRANHLKGLLRLAGEELAGFDASIESDLTNLLGEEGGNRGLLRLTSLRMESTAKDRTLTWTSSARELGGRRPRHDTLRVVEHIKAGTVFVARIRHPESVQHQYLLERLIRRIDCLGSNRRRGGGLILADLKPEAAVGRLPVQTVSGSVLRIALRNLDPLCLSATGNPENLITSLCFVRGQTLLGALMAWALDRKDQAALEALKAAYIGDAMPLPEALNNTPLDTLKIMPVPLSVLTPKPVGGNPQRPWWIGPSGSGQAYDGLDPTRPLPDEKPKRPGSQEYLAQEKPGEPWLRYSPTMAVHMRHQSADIYDAPGTPLTEPSLFSMEEIAEETRFVSDIRFKSPSEAQDFLTHFGEVIGGGEWLTVGREGRPMEVEPSPVSITVPPATTTFGDDWTLTLTSDLVARGPGLGFYTDLDPVALMQLADMAVANFPEAKDWRMKGYAETELLHGFNAATGLRRGAALAIRRGSCWQVSGPGSGKLAAVLSKLAALGERTHEGLGRFVLDVQPITVLAKPANSTESEILPNPMEELWGKVKDIAAQVPARRPSLSQLQWLREMAQAATNDAEFKILLDEVVALPTKRERSGAPWKGFPVGHLRQECESLSIESKRLVLSRLVQWLALEEKQNLREKQS